jgi:hypothetical protein
MSEFLETLKARMADAQKRFLTAQQKLQIAQSEHQAAAQEFTSWQNAVQAETRREQARNGIVPVSAVTNQTQSNQTPNAPESNKTEVVRELLRQHPMGITPSELWKKLNGQMAYRAYLYSVLKRLKDRGEATERRGKYFLRVVTQQREESKEQAIVQ